MRVHAVQPRVKEQTLALQREFLMLQHELLGSLEERKRFSDFNSSFSEHEHPRFQIRGRSTSS
ncbi:hypothetical protein EXN66_Car021740 [Channa argus]|uniref:Uncharacterized protein n=1 Tax=Channa argus TaxID=215402 RepID=A0A6G1QUQ8_CHAAH|nr:hypothetical protein EXN66_Car021740 [Channa argus]